MAYKSKATLFFGWADVDAAIGDNRFGVVPDIVRIFEYSLGHTRAVITEIRPEMFVIFGV